MRVCIAAVIVLISAASLPAQNADKMEQEYQALAAVRTKSEVAIRKLQAWFADNETRWQKTHQAAEVSCQSILRAIDKAHQDEERKGEDARNEAVMEDLTGRRTQVEADWNGQGTDREAAEREYRRLAQQAEALAESWQGLVNLEKSWKDTHIDLAPIQAAHEALAARVAGLAADGEKAMASAEAIQKAWETAVATNTRPVMPK